MNDLPKLTESEFAALNACQSADEWSAAVADVKKARDGGYPPDWYERMLKTGLADEINGRWGRAGFGLTSFKTAEDLGRHMRGERVLDVVNEVPGLPEHVFDGVNCHMDPVKARLRVIQRLQPALPDQLARLAGLYAEHLGNAQELNSMGVVLSLTLFEHDLEAGKSGWTGREMRNPLAGMPSIVKRLSMLGFRAAVIDQLPEKFRAEVKQTFKDMEEAARAATPQKHTGFGMPMEVPYQTVCSEHASEEGVAKPAEESFDLDPVAKLPED